MSFYSPEVLGNSSTTSSCVLKRGSSYVNSIWVLSILLLTAAMSSIQLLTAVEVKHTIIDLCIQTALVVSNRLAKVTVLFGASTVYSVHIC